MRRQPHVALLCALVTALAAVTIPSLAASAAVDEAPQSGPSVVEVPYLGSLDVQPAEGWQFGDCAPLVAATPLVTACSPAAFTVAAPTFDASAPPVRVAVPLVNGDTTVSVDYIIRLAPPPAPDMPDSTIPLAVAAGETVLFPLSELGMECGLCTPGTASVEVDGVDPASAGRAWTTGAHLVFAAAPGADGEAQVGVRLVDDLGRRTKTALVTVHDSPAITAPLHGLHLQRPMPQEPLTLTAADLAFAMPETPALLVVDCGSAISGAVSCTPEGAVTYVPAAGAVTDQFAVQLTTEDGRQAVTSVTFSDAESAAAIGPLAPGAGAGTAPLRVGLPVPVEGSGGDRGATTSFTEMLDRLGAR